MKEHQVYHIRTKGNTDLSSGYIGVTNNISRRMCQHKHSGLLNNLTEMVILFVGTKDKCHYYEWVLRPWYNIGLNKAPGGNPSMRWYQKYYRFPTGKDTKIKPGQHHSKDTEIKPGQHLSVATEFKPGMTPHNYGKGKQYILTDPNGKSHIVDVLTVFCKIHNLTPQNIRKVAKGQRNYHKGWKAEYLY